VRHQHATATLVSEAPRRARTSDACLGVEDIVGIATHLDIVATEHLRDPNGPDHVFAIAGSSRVVLPEIVSAVARAGTPTTPAKDNQ